MPTRTLIVDDGMFRTYESYDDAGNLVGTHAEPVNVEPEPPTDMERLAAVLVDKVAALTEADVAKALGVHEDRVAAASAEMAKERTR